MHHEEGVICLACHRFKREPTANPDGRPNFASLESWGEHMIALGYMDARFRDYAKEIRAIEWEPSGHAR